MYTILLCPDCQFIWIVQDKPKTTSCPRCRKRHKFGKLRHLKKLKSKDDAKKVRAAFTADFNDMKGEFEKVVEESDIFSDYDPDIGRQEMLEELANVDSEELKKANEMGQSSSRSQKDIVYDAFSEVEEPTHSNIVEYATERGVPEGKAERLIKRLRDRGEVINKGGKLEFV